MNSPNRKPHSPPQKSGLYMSGDFKEAWAVHPSAALSPDQYSTWLKRTTATAPITPAAKQIAARWPTVKALVIVFKSFPIARDGSVRGARATALSPHPRRAGPG